MNNPACQISRRALSEHPWRIVFFGSADFSLPALEALNSGPDNIVLVVCPPPAPVGRGRKLTPSPVSSRAEELGLKRLETKSVKAPNIVNQIRETKPDLLVVAAFGGFLPKELLEIAPWPPLNIHPSLLPRHRGAAPVNWSLISGDQELGVSIIFLEEEMDAGPILSQRSFAVNQDGPNSAGAWEARLAQAGAEDVMKVIETLKSGSTAVYRQNSGQRTINRLLCKADGHIDFNRPSRELAGLINGVDPWPGAQSKFKGKILKFFGASFDLEPQNGKAGEVLGLDAEGRLIVAAGEGALLIREFQPEGRQKISAADFCRGYRPEKLGTDG